MPDDVTYLMLWQFFLLFLVSFLEFFNFNCIFLLTVTVAMIVPLSFHVARSCMLILSLDFACPRLGTDILNQAMDPQRFPMVREEAYHGLVQDGLYQLAESGITSTVDARSGISIWDFF